MVCTDPHLLVLTPAPEEPRFARLAGEMFERLAGPLRGAGLSVEARSWTEVGDLAGVDAVTPLLAWSYHLRAADWAALLERLRRARVRTINDVAVLAWNTRKTYLAELAARGAPVVPTLFADRLDPSLIAEARARFGPELVAKPQISGGAFQTVRLREHEPRAATPEGPVMLQPFLPSVNGEGELSMFYFGGRFSHAVAKRPASGDFRVQIQYGGVNTAVDPAADAFAAAEAVLRAAGRDLTYARIDLIRAPDGVLSLMELEAIEPDLFLTYAPDGGEAFGRAMRTAADG